MKIYHIVIALLIATLCIAPAAASEPITGDWEVKGTMPFMFFTIECASGTAELYEDGTGIVSGSANILFINLMTLSDEPVTWKKTGENQYSVSVLGTTVPVKYSPADDVLTASVSTGQFGIGINITISGTATRA